MSDQHNLINEIYRNTSLQKIPWNNENPPELLAGLVESGKIEPCRIVDLGCGAGNYILYFASLGFDATGIDMSPEAIEIARKNARSKNIKCEFIVADIVKELDEVEQKWDFAYDWSVLHHIFPEDRAQYVKNVHKILSSRGRYLSACFSDKDTSFETPGKYRKTSIGTVLYFSSEEELRELFAPYFNIIEMKTVEVAGKTTPHVFNYVLMARK
ncbi:MAG: class I SAM-dependent methyltransferase [Sedimentisphaerales bacterium]